MTNETNQNGREGSKRLLIVEDNPYYASNAVKAVRARGYEPVVACDLEDARNEIAKGGLAGIITDMQFNEKGLSGACFSHALKCPDEMVGDNRSPELVQIDRSVSLRNLTKCDFTKIDEVNVLASFVSALTKSHLKITSNRYGSGERMWTRLQPEIDKILRERLVNELATPELMTACRNLPYPLGHEIFERPSDFIKHLRRDQELTVLGGAPLGYFVIEEARKQNIPVAAVTGTGHTPVNLPALIKSGMTDVTELIAHEDNTRIDARTFMDARDMTLGSYFEYAGFCDGFDVTERFAGYAGDKAEEFINFNWNSHNDFPRIMQHSILTGHTKSNKIYNFAIDMLEGKIDETRPYRIKTQEEMKGGNK